eukprot:3140871-Alexandrium_andersonii.AAC.1
MPGAQSSHDVRNGETITNHAEIIWQRAISVPSACQCQCQCQRVRASAASACVPERLTSATSPLHLVDSDWTPCRLHRGFMFK